MLPPNFFNIENNEVTSDQLVIRVIPTPLEISTSYEKGTRLAPLEILAASPQLEDYDMQLDCTPTEQYRILTDLSIYEDLINCESYDDMNRAIELIADKAKTTWQAGEVPLFLGGEHTISLAVISALAEFNKSQDISVVQIDAHADLYPEYDGHKIHHASVFHHVGKLFPVHQIGIRVMNRVEKEVSQKNDNIHTYSMKWLRETPNGFDSIIEKIQDDYVYLSFDLDGLDPSIMQAVGTPVPGGLFWDETMTFLEMLFKKKKVIGADVVELSPRRELHASNFAASLLTYKMMAFKFSKLEA